MAIKVNAGKLRLGMTFPTLVQNHVTNNGIAILNIEASHLEEFSRLPIHHKDPFDRLLITQARVENIPVLSRDALFDQYEIKRVWG